MYITKEEKNNILEILHFQYLQFMISSISNLKNNEELLFEEIIESEPLLQIYKYALGFSAIKNIEENLQEFQATFQKFIKLLLFTLKNSDPKILSNFYLKISQTEYNQDIISAIKEIAMEKKYPYRKLDLIINLDLVDPELLNLLQVLDLVLHIPQTLMKKFPLAKEWYENFSLFKDHCISESDKMGYTAHKTEINELFIKAVRANDLDAVQEQLRQGADVNYIMCNSAKDNYFTPLYFACFKNAFPLTQLLIQNNADVTIPDSKSQSYPVHIAALTGSLEILQLLVEKGKVSIYVTNQSGDTPLHTAVKSNNLLITKYLIDNRSPYRNYLQKTNNNGQSAYEIAKHKNNIKLIELFQQKQSKKDPEAANNNNYTEKKVPDASPKPRAPGFYFPGTNISAKDSFPIFNGQTVGDIKNTLQDIKEYEPIFKANCIISSNPLFSAIGKNETLDVIAKILKENPKLILSQDSDGNNALHAVCLYKDSDAIKIVNLLCKQGCNSSKQNKFGVPPSHLAVNFGNHNVLKALLDVNPTLSDVSYQSSPFSFS